MAEEGSDDSDRTEEPTARRLQEAHEKGDVVKSLEVVTFFALAAITLAILASAGYSSRSLVVPMRGLIEHSVDLSVDGGGLRRLFLSIGKAIAVALAIPLGILALGALAGNLIQHRLVFSASSLEPRFSKISPLAGLKRLLSIDNLVNFLRGLIKVVVLGTVMFSVLWPERDRLDALVTIDIMEMLPVAESLSIKMLGTIVAMMFLIAVLDYAWVYWRWRKRHMMSLKEIKDEHKQTEGDPMIKGKIRQLRQDRARNRMMSKVPNATVVVTNPTHYAVALQYEAAMQAPVCVAKGADEVALRIRETAREAGVPVIENPPLARSLYASVELDQMIPEQHYKAVAQLISQIMNTRRQSSWRK
jgi:flagellar biosynthetic protein FlhB